MVLAGVLGAAVGATLGATLGAITGAASAGSSFLAVLLPSLLIHPAFISKSSAMISYVFTFSQGLKSARDGINPDQIVHYYSAFMIAPPALLFLLYAVGSGSFGFSTVFFVPIVAVNAMALAATYKALLATSRQDDGNMQGIEKAPPTMAVSSSPLTAEDSSAVELSEIYRESEAEIPHLETATAGAMEEQKSEAQSKGEGRGSSPSARGALQRMARAFLRSTCKALCALFGGMAFVGALCASRGILKGALWWAPKSLTEFFRRDKAHSLFTNFVKITCVLVVLSPTLVLGAWALFFTYHGESSAENMDYIADAYELSFAFFSDWKLRVPALLFSFDLSILGRIPDALRSLSHFSSLPPLEFFDASESFGVLALLLAWIKPLVSVLAAALAQLGAIENPNQKLGDLARGDATLSDMLAFHAHDEDHDALLKHLDTKGFDTSKMVVNEETRQLEAFVIFVEKDRAKVVGDRVLDSLALYGGLKKIDLNECKDLEGE